MPKIGLSDGVGACTVAANGTLLAAGNDGNLHLITASDDGQANVKSLPNAGKFDSNLPLLQLHTGGKGPVVGFRGARTASFLALKKADELPGDVSFTSDVRSQNYFNF